MRLFINLFFLTFVLMPIASNSNPSPKSKQNSQNYEYFEDEEIGVQDPSKTESTQMGYPKGKRQIPLATPKRPQLRGPQDFGAHVGLMGGDIQDSGQKVSTTYLGLAYLRNDPNHKASWDFHLEIGGENIVGLIGGRRWYFDRDDFFKSFYKVAIGNYVKSGEMIAGLIHFRHFKILGIFGVADLFEMNRKVYAEAGVGYGEAGLMTQLHVGYLF